MSILNIYPEQWSATDGSVDQIQQYSDSQQIRHQLADIGVQFETWVTAAELSPTATEDAILAAYSDQVDRLKEQHDFRTADVIKLNSDHPDRAALRQKFLSEHTHSDFEVRFFVAGQGLFYIHHQDRVYAVLCQSGDLISVPAGTRHWFDMGEAPSFTCIRLFSDPQGWVADYTGDAIAERFPLLEQFISLAA
jgi:1,2-dihydroxy-3-keto-5-methylthiopentene dioxygenase